MPEGPHLTIAGGDDGFIASFMPYDYPTKKNARRVVSIDGTTWTSEALAQPELFSALYQDHEVSYVRVPSPDLCPDLPGFGGVGCWGAVYAEQVSPWSMSGMISDDPSDWSAYEPGAPDRLVGQQTFYQSPEPIEMACTADNTCLAMYGGVIDGAGSGPYLADSLVGFAYEPFGTQWKAGVVLDDLRTHGADAVLAKPDLAVRDADRRFVAAFMTTADCPKTLAKELRVKRTDMAPGGTARTWSPSQLVGCTESAPAVAWHQRTGRYWLLYTDSTTSATAAPSAPEPPRSTTGIDARYRFQMDAASARSYDLLVDGRPVTPTIYQQRAIYEVVTRDTWWQKPAARTITLAHKTSWRVPPVSITVRAQCGTVRGQTPHTTERMYDVSRWGRGTDVFALLDQECKSNAGTWQRSLQWIASQ